MSPPGAADPLYVLARRVLLDALDALGAQRTALILVGAQAIYLHTGPAGLAVAEYTTDVDIALDPQFLSDSPKIGEAVQAADFHPVAAKVGSWTTKRSLGGKDVDVQVDLLVPDAVGGAAGRRGARLGVHGNKVARRARGLEAALVDKKDMTVSSLEPADKRKFVVAVAGPTALLISKLHKISERQGQEKPGRVKDKDALDVLRLLRKVETGVFADMFARLSLDNVAGPVTREAVGLLEQLFAAPAAAGSQMAAHAAAPMESPETTAASCVALSSDLLRMIKK